MQFIQKSIPNHKPPPHNPNPSSTSLPYKYRQENSTCSWLNIRRKWSSALLEPLPRISPSPHSSLRTTFISHRKPLSVSIEPRFVAPIQVCSSILFIFFKFLQPSRGGGEGEDGCYFGWMWLGSAGPSCFGFPTQEVLFKWAME